MNKPTNILISFAAAIATVSAAGSAAAQGVTVGKRQIPQSDNAKLVATGTLVCRGGEALRWEGPFEVEKITHPTIPGTLYRVPSSTKVKLVRLIFQVSRGAAGPQGLGLQEPSQCGFTDKPWPDLSFPPAIEIDAASVTFDERSGVNVPVSRRSSIQGYLTDTNHFWTFDVELREFRGAFEAKAHRRLDVPILTDAATPVGGAMSNAMKPAAQGQAAVTESAVATRERGRPGDTAALNPQPLPPKDTPIQTGQNVLPNPVERRGLNPQPLPPKEPSVDPGPGEPSAAQAAASTVERTSGMAPAPQTFAIPQQTYSVPARTAWRDIQQAGSTPVADARAAAEAQQIKGEAASGPVRIAGRDIQPADSTPVANARAAAEAQQVKGQTGVGNTADLKIDCTTNWPRISHVQGTITPGAQFTINGSCFGNETGYVEIIGQFPGGNLKPAFADWKPSAIVAIIPTGLSGISDHTIAISVRRAGDKKQSVAKQERFVAARDEGIDVPLHLWEPNGNFTHADHQDSGLRVFGRPFFSYPGASETSFRLAINPQCALTDLQVPASVGGIHEIKGWDNGPPHQANVQVVWGPRCVSAESGSAFAGSRETACSIAFELKAKASCPKGFGVDPSGR